MAYPDCKLPRLRVWLGVVVCRPSSNRTRWHPQRLVTTQAKLAGAALIITMNLLEGAAENYLTGCSCQIALSRNCTACLFVSVSGYYRMEKKLAALVVLTFLLHPATAQLSVDFYAKTCPNVEAIVLQVVKSKSQQSSIVAPATLRLFFHDCWVRGCDASVLLSSTPGNVAERDAPPNQSLAGDGFDVVVKSKQAVEAACPGVVSCADILAIAARDLVGLVGGPSWQVAKGRRDGTLSLASEATANLPGENFNVDQLVASFASKGLSQDEMVALSGGHTIGFSHCDSFTNRLYSFSSSSPTDPSLDPNYATTLKQTCPLTGGDTGTVVPFDITTSFTFDKAYYSNLVAGKGLLFSDEVLFTDSRTQSLVKKFSKKTSTFFTAFSSAITKMGAVGVLTGTQGEIRRDCSKIN